MRKRSGGAPPAIDVESRAIRSSRSLVDLGLVLLEGAHQRAERVELGRVAEHEQADVSRRRLGASAACRERGEHEGQNDRRDDAEPWHGRGLKRRPERLSRPDFWLVHAVFGHSAVISAEAVRAITEP
jgi:hypothetical protein